MSFITSIDHLDFSKMYTYADYLKWQFRERVEILHGKVVRMAPAPNLKHQRVTGDLYGFIWQFLKQQETKCQVFVAPFDVVLAKNDKSNVVQPDICVVCDTGKLTTQGCEGAPALIVEVLSPGNSRREMKDKFELYEESGVEEYWLVHPGEEYVIIYTLNAEGRYQGSKPFLTNDVVSSKLIPGFTLAVSELFSTL